MKAYVSSCLRLFVCLLIFSAVYPVMALLNGAFSRNGSFIEYGAAIGFGMAVFYLRDLLIKRCAPAFFTFFAPILLILSGSVCSAVYFFNHTPSPHCILAAIVFGILALLTGIFAFHMSGRLIGDMLSTGIIALITGVDLIAFLFISGFSFPFYGWISMLDYFLLCSIRFVLYNQNNLEEITASRHYSFADLPQKIRSYNFKLVVRLIALITAAFLLLLNAKSILSWLFAKISEFLKYILLAVLSALPENENTVIEEIQGGMQGGMDFTELGPPTETWLIWKILEKLSYVLVFCGGIALLIYLIYRICKWKIPRKTYEKNPEYEDSEQLLDTKKRSGRKHNYNRRRWNKDYSAYRKMKDGEEKFHIGYLLAVRGLQLSGLPLQCSDTPCEIDSKSKTFLKEDEYHLATNKYNLMFYAENQYSAEALKQMDEALQEISELKKDSVISADILHKQKKTTD